MADYKFFRQDLKRWIETPEETWYWEAHYEDGQVLKQFDDEGIFHQFTEIDQSRLAIFKMKSKHYPQSYSILFSDPNMKLIHFYRNSILNAGTDCEERQRLYCFGYEKHSKTNTLKVVMIITPSNELVITEEPTLL